MDYFVKLPNDLFYKKENEGNSILKQINNNKVVMILDYIYTSTNRKNITKFTLEDMVISCGFKCDTHKKSNNEQFREILAQLKELRIIKSEYEMKDIKINQMITCTLEIDLSNKFIQIYDSERDKILNQNNIKIDNIKLFIYYCYLKSRIYKRSEEEGLLAIRGGRAEVTWVSYYKINDDLGLSHETIKKYNDVLVNINLIRIGDAGKWHYLEDKTKQMKDSANIYALYDVEEGEWILNLKEGIKYYKKLKVNEDKEYE
jgi:hypothetical protein